MHESRISKDNSSWITTKHVSCNAEELLGLIGCSFIYSDSDYTFENNYVLSMHESRIKARISSVAG